GNVVTYTHDILGNITKTVNAMGHAVVYTYDKSGRLLSLKDPVGNTTTYQYDEYGRLSVTTRPDGRTFTYTYNTLNQITTVTDSAGRQTTLEYDASGNITKIARGDAWISYVYNGRNDLTEINSDFSHNGRNLRYYDEDGRLIQDWFRDRVYYSYDADGNLATIKVNDKTITYTRNSLGQLQSLSDGGNTFSFSYDENNQRKSITYPNGLQTTMTYNAATQLTSLNDGLKQNSYNYNPNGMLTQKTVDGTSKSYTYDSINRVINAGTENYSYNTAGNILNNGATYDEKTYKLLSTNQYTLEYDAFGNLTKKTDKTTGDYKVYTWNDWDMLMKVESFDNNDISTKKIEYTYDPSGRRDTKTIDGNRYTYNNYGDTPISMNNNGNYSWFLYDEGIDRPLAITNDADGETYFYHRDYLGSVTALSDSSGTEVESYSYDAYGKTTKSSTVDTGNRFAFTGREMDDEDLYYYRARYYDPTIQQFLSEDLIGFASGDFNFYRYVLNSPVNYIDPYGYGFWGTIGSMAAGATVGILATGAAIVSAPAAIGAGAGLVIYTVGKGMYDAGQTMKTIIKKKKENATIEDPIDRYEANKKINSWGLKKAKKLTEDLATAPGTGLGGAPLTSVEDVIVTVINAAAGDTIYSSDYHKKRKNNHKNPCH
ncbi:RHS repeat-associated core domain-containing protein, partial [Sulfurovum sp.]